MKLLSLAFVISVLFRSPIFGLPADNKSFPLFEVDLDLTPFERWKDIAIQYRDQVPVLHKVIVSEVEKVLPARAVNTIELIARQLNRFLKSEFAEEIRGFVHYSGANIGDVVIINFMYEVNAFKDGCTTILAQNRDDEVILARNMDYLWAPILRNLTFMVNFKKAGQVVFTTIGFPGLVGATQGMRPGAYAIDQDERDKGSWEDNILAFLVNALREEVSPMPILIREILQSNLNFDQAAQALQTTPQMAPGYFMIVGTQPGQGMVITRNRMNTADIWRVDKSRGRWYILETNFDHWGPPGDRRRDTAEKLMNATE